MPIYRDTGWRRERAREKRGKETRGEVRIRVSTLVVHLMQDRPRHDPRSPRHILDAPCKLSCTVPSGTARYVIGSWILDSLHAGALPVGRIVRVVRRGPHMRPVAYQCARHRVCTFFAERRRGSLSFSLPFSVSFLLSSVPLVPSLFLPREHTRATTKREKGEGSLDVSCAIRG